ncbi:MAG TPA: ester cyclase [Candidatus Dormibacteraeota bacterium]
MGTQENKDIVRRQLEVVFNQGKGSAAVPEFWADEAASDGGPQGRAQLAKHIDMMLASFPDWKFTVHELIAEGDRVVAHLSVKATYQKPFPALAEIPAVGQPVAREQVNIFTLRDGRITHLHVVADNSTMQRMAAEGAKTAAR